MLPFKAYNASGDMQEINVSLHVSLSIYALPISNNIQHRDRVERVEKILSEVETFYHDDKPLHIISPAESAFYCISHADYKKLSEKEVLTIFRSQSIVISKTPISRPLDFDEDSFEMLNKELTTPISIHGLFFYIEFTYYYF